MRPLPRPPRPPRDSHSRLQSRRLSPGSGEPKLVVRVALWPPPMSRLYWRNVGGAARRSRGGSGAAPPPLLLPASERTNSWYRAAVIRPDATWSKGRAEGESEGEGEGEGGGDGEGGGGGRGGGWRGRVEVRTRLWARFFCGSTQRAKLRLPAPRANRAITRPRRPPRYRARLAPPRPLARLSSRAMGRTLRRPGGFVGGPGSG